MAKTNAATALDMIPALGARILVRCESTQRESMQVECIVLNVKNSWGQPRLLVTPVSGTGEQWIQMERASIIPPATHNHVNDGYGKCLMPGCMRPMTQFFEEVKEIDFQEKRK